VTMDWLAADPAPSQAPEPTAHQSRRPRARRDDGGPPTVRAAPPTRAGRTMAGAEPSLVPTTQVDLWVPLGPSVTLRGQADRGPRISGRVRAIAVSNDGQRIYAGSAQGGVWFSDDGGERWLALDFYATTRTPSGQLGEANALAVGSVAVFFGAASNGDDDDVYVGTGEQRKGPFGPLPGSMQGVGIRVAHGPAATVRTEGPTAEAWTLEATDLAGASVLRLAREDRAGFVWAATSQGLYRRTPIGVATWIRVDSGLDATTITDVLVTRGQGAEPRRIYAASSKPAVAWSVTGEPGSWTVVDLPETPPEHRADQFVTRVALAEGNTPGNVVVYALAGNPRLWRIDDSTPEVVIGLPERLFRDQAAYDMAIAVHPPSADTTLHDRIAVGGSTVRRTENEPYNAALFAAAVRKTSGVWRFELGGILAEEEGLPPSWIGGGVHADVHDLSWISGPGGQPQLWVACDGGVFRSEPIITPGRFNGFKARNSGLATLEAQYLAQHPTSDAIVIAGTQDNGTIRWLGAGTWVVARAGDGGGVGIDPRDPRRMLWQYIQGDWNVSTNAGVNGFDRGPLPRPPDGATKELKETYEKVTKAENKASSFYSNCAVIDTGTVTQAAVGTDRVWYTTDWGEHWVTLPSLAKPYDPTTPGTPEHTADVYSPISVLRWANPNRLYVLSRAGIDVFNRSGATWSTSRIYDAESLRDTKPKNRPTDVIPLELPVTDIVVHDEGKGTLYAGTSGVDGEHVWWFNGAGRWIRALLWVRDADGVLRRLDSPVHAVVVDPAHPEIVYAGTDIGVYKGIGTFPATGDPTWAWTQYSNGLPEAACIDLVIHREHRLLRAALRGRGVWEVALDGVEQKPQAYLRAHAFDTRRKPIPAAGTPDPTGDPVAPSMLRLDASPDVRVFRAPGTKAPRPFTFATGKDGFDTWVIQSALIAKGVALEANGIWTPAMNAALRTPIKTVERWDEVVGPPRSNVLPFDHNPPDAADLAANLRDEPDRRPPPNASCQSSKDTVRIFVAVHGRDWRPLTPDKVRITVLRIPFNHHADLSGLSALPAGWAAALITDSTASTPSAWPTDTPWAYVDPVKPFRTPLRPIDPSRGEVVSWDVKLPTPDASTSWLLLAVVVHAEDGDRLDTPETWVTDVATVVRTVRHVAARSVRIVD
jgi:hypothetical protein